jgi:hypothetical protein
MREVVDKAYGKKGWLKISVSSVRNVGRIGLGRLVLKVCWGLVVCCCIYREFTTTLVEGSMC